MNYRERPGFLQLLGFPFHHYCFSF
uniref:Uncharacterized protein n=1 Tax=Anguilla anguilla TaxID=7936 RepID=A0A0E9T7V4_ANGAN